MHIICNIFQFWLYKVRYFIIKIPEILFSPQNLEYVEQDDF
jgi:hypothetical protein